MLERLQLDFEASGGTDFAYLNAHYSRFETTKRLFESTWSHTQGTRLLDVGAHWLHQAACWAADGYRVTAVDLPATTELPQVRRFAERYGIDVVTETDLEQAASIAALPESSFDVVLFTEILEHITFNPVTMWQSIHRALAPGGRIVITTPNYYAARGRFWDPGRLFKGMGGGISAREILDRRTYGHHWKEFSAPEIVDYFSALSTDFNAVKVVRTSEYAGAAGRLLALAERIAALRANLHVEIELTRKVAGITAKPCW